MTSLKPVADSLDRRIIEVYQATGKLLRSYRVGALPRALLLLPILARWESFISYTKPKYWSPHALFQVTCLFLHTSNASSMERYANLVLLPRIRNEIQENRRLHFMIFQSIKKALLEPEAFYKGVLLPLCGSCNSTIRETNILSSVLRQMSIPRAPSTAALLKLTEMEFFGTTCHLIKVLLEKKYFLSSCVVDALVDYFVRFRNTRHSLPVVWHQSLLTFVQKYKSEICEEDQLEIKTLTRVQYHHQISPQVQSALNVNSSLKHKDIEKDKISNRGH